jgi:hypothetical protein
MSRTLVQTYDWRAVLDAVYNLLFRLPVPENPLVASVYHSAISSFKEILLDMPHLTLSEPGIWRRLYAELQHLSSSCAVLAYFPPVRLLFSALHRGLNEGVGTQSRWSNTPAEHRDDAIQYLLQHIGGELAGLHSDYYNTFLPVGGDRVMLQITKLLLHGRLLHGR